MAKAFITATDEQLQTINLLQYGFVSGQEIEVEEVRGLYRVINGRSVNTSFALPKSYVQIIR